MHVSAGGSGLVCMWKSDDNLWSWSSLSTFRQGLLFMVVYTRLAGLQAPGNFHVFASHLSIQTKITDWYKHTWLYVDSGDSNSCLHACVTYPLSYCPSLVLAFAISCFYVHIKVLLLPERSST